MVSNWFSYKTTSGGVPNLGQDAWFQQNVLIGLGAVHDLKLWGCETYSREEGCTIYPTIHVDSRAKRRCILMFWPSRYSG